MSVGRTVETVAKRGRTRARLRWILIAPAGALLLLGLAAGLVLAGVPLPIATSRLPELHATLLVFGFLGAVVSLERAIALRVWWPYTAPALLLVGSLLTLTTLPLLIGQVAVAGGLVLHLFQYRAIWRRQQMAATAIQALGAASAVSAAIAWCGGVPPSRLVPLLAVFLVLTIAGERLELARISAPGARPENTLLALAVALALAATLTLTSAELAVPLAGFLLMLMTAWLVRHDIARTTVRMTGLPRFVALCLLIGYGWLSVAGAGWLLGGARTEGAVYDATTHAIFLGFVMSMIMAHAPIILPAVLGVRVPYHRSLFVPVALLQVGLVVRVVVADAWGAPFALVVAGLIVTAALLLFGATVATLSLRARPRAKVRHDVTT